MNRVTFISRMAQGKLTRRQMLQGAAAFGVGALVLPARLGAAELVTCMEWAGYDAVDYYQPFMKKHGKQPAFSIFANEEEALQKVLAGFNADVMHPCNYSLDRFVKAGIAAPIDTAKLSNWKDVFPALQSAPSVLVNGSVMMMPADWGNSSIAYRPDLVDDDFKKNETWGIFADDKYAGRVAMTDNEVVYTIAALLKGMTPEQAQKLTPEQLEALKPLAEKIVKNARFLWTDVTEINQGLASGEVVAAYAWNDTIKNLTAQKIPIAYAKPKEGFFTWYCGLTMLNKGKGDPAAVYDFLDAWLSPETGKVLIEGSGYGHSNMKAFEVADKAAVAAMGFTDPVEHMKSGILFETVDQSYITAWEATKALKQ